MLIACWLTPPLFWHWERPSPEAKPGDAVSCSGYCHVANQRGTRGKKCAPHILERGGGGVNLIISISCQEVSERERATRPQAYAAIYSPLTAQWADDDDDDVIGRVTEQLQCFGYSNTLATPPSHNSHSMTGCPVIKSWALTWTPIIRLVGKHTKHNSITAALIVQPYQ